MEEVKEKAIRRRHRVPRWLTRILTIVVTLAVTLASEAFLLGWDGMAVVQGWMLSRWMFVEEDADLRAASDGAMYGMISGLGDRWSYYVDAERYDSLLERRSNRYIGIGVTVSKEDERGLYIESVTPDTPAQEAGLEAGEIIIAVDGADLSGENRFQTELLAGEAGEKRVLRILSQSGEEREVTVELSAIPTVIAAGRLLENGVGVVALKNFNWNSFQAFKEETDSLVEQGASALVFDMRGNGGGYLDQLIQILDYLLPEGVIFQGKPRWGSRYESESDAECIDLPFAVLVDEGTYSAAELFAAQLRESVGSVIVGEATSGKGYSQKTIPLLNGGAVGISTAAYFTGSGVSLIGQGITPDKVISLTEEQETQRAAGQLAPEDDPQLQAALELLQE